MNKIDDEQLHDAVQHGDRDLVRKLLADGHSPNYFDDLSFTPLHYAVQKEDYFLIKILLEHGADINAQNLETDAGNTPLGDVAGQASAELIEYLLEKGADPTKRGWMQLNAIDRAKSRRDSERYEVLKLLSSFS